MRSTSYLHAALLGIGLLSGAVSALAADALVNSDAIIKSLTMRPKAVQTKDGKWVTPDPTLDLNVPFDNAKSTLTAAGQMQLDQLALAFAHPSLAQSRFELAGHTNQVGAADYNMKLSLERAASVRDYLNQRHGIALDRLLTQGYGFSRPADPANPTAAINRRVEVRHLVQQAYGAGLAPVLPQPVQQPYAQPVQQPYAQPVQQPYAQPAQPAYIQSNPQPSYPQPVQGYGQPAGGQIVPRQ